MPATAAVTASSPWSIDGTCAVVRVAGHEARLDLAAPAIGLALPADAGGDRFLGIDLGPRPRLPVEYWIRGSDLAAVYEPDDARRLRTTAMWRVRPGTVAAWELVVSAQTSLLDADATLAVVADVAGDECRRPVACGGDPVGGRLADGPLPADASGVLVARRATAVIVAVHPEDPRRIAVATGGGRVRVRCDLFPTALEKGVILRSRVLAAIGPAAGADAWAAAVCGAFAASPPFLDT